MGKGMNTVSDVIAERYGLRKKAVMKNSFREDLYYSLHTSETDEPKCTAFNINP